MPTRARFTLAIVIAASVGSGSFSFGSGRPVAAAGTGDAWTRLAFADTLFQSLQADSALVVLRRLDAENSQARDDSLSRAIRLKQGEILATIGRSQAAVPILLQVLASLDGPRDDRWRCRAERWLAYSLELQGRGAEATSHYARVLELAQELGDREHEGYARLGLAYLRMLGGRAAEAVDGFKQAIDLFHQLGLGRFEILAMTGLGCSYDAIGEMDRAAQIFSRIVREARRLNDPWTLAHALNDLGGLEFRRGDPAAAVYFFEQAADLQLKNLNPEGSLVPTTNLATAQTALGRLDDAASALEEALDLCVKQGFRARRPPILEQLGTVRRLQGRLAESAAMLREALALGRGFNLDARVNIALALVKTVAEEDSVDAAIAILERETDGLRERISPALDISVEREMGELLLRRAQTRPALSHFLAAESVARRMKLDTERVAPLALAARCYRALDLPDSALALMLRASDAWERQRGRSQDPEWREQLGLDARYLYTSLGDLLLEHSPDVAAFDRTRMAFERLQEFKARTLFERMHGPGNATDVEPISWRAQSPKVADVREVLGEGEVFLDFFVGSDVSLLFAVDRRECRAVRLPGLDTGLGPALERFRALLTRPPGEPASTDGGQLVQAAGDRLGSLLLSPLGDLVADSRRLIVAPDGILNQVPFGMLGSPGTGNGARRPLLDTHEVVCVPSATVLVDLRRRAKANTGTTPPRDVLAMASGGGNGAPSLPGAIEEVVWLDRRFQGVDLRSSDRHGGPLQPADLGRYGVLHLASHTLLDDQHPWRSGILCDSPDSSAGVYLRASDILPLRLGATLAVLSGCESASGRVLSGEGVLGLTGAFTSAGVPAVVATLWPVQDRTTTRLVREFYDSLEHGETVAASLRRAQLALRADPRTRHPFYWAGFIVVGDGDVRVPLRRRVPVGTTAATVVVAAAVLVALSSLRPADRRRKEDSR